MPLAARGIYTADTKPYVFINEHTKVLVQGMTGKHVSITGVMSHRWRRHRIFISWLRDRFLKLIELFAFRELSTPSSPLPTALKSSVVSTLARQVQNISDFQSSATLPKQRRQPRLRLPLSTCHLPLPPMPSSRPSKPKSTSSFASPKESQPST